MTMDHVDIKVRFQHNCRYFMNLRISLNQGFLSDSQTSEDCPASWEAFYDCLWDDARLSLEGRSNKVTVDPSMICLN